MGLHELVPALADYYAQLREVLRHERAQREIEVLRQRFRGVSRWDPYNDHFPRLTYKTDGLDAQLTVWPEGTPLAWMRIHFSFICPLTGTLVSPYPTAALISAGLDRQEMHPSGLSRIETGDSALDASLVTLAKEAGSLKRLLTREARAAILDLYYLVAHHTLYIGLEHDRAVVKKVLAADTLSADLLTRMGGMAARLVAAWVEELKEPAGAVIALAPTVWAQQIIRCRICGQTMLLDGVLCRRCDTPHHRDCWDYNGQCSVYACGSHQYRLP